MSVVSFESVEKEAQDLIKEISKNETLTQFRLEFEKTLRTLLNSHENEKRMMKKCTELNAEIVSLANKMQSSLKLSSEDNNTILHLKQQIEKVYKLGEISREKEARAKENIQELTREISALHKSLDNPNALTAEFDKSIQDMIKQKEELKKEKDALDVQYVGILNETNSLTSSILKLETERDKLVGEINVLTKEIAERKLEFNKEQKSKEQAEIELKETKIQLEIKHKEIIDTENKIEDTQVAIKKMREKLNEQNTSTSQAEKSFQRVKELKEKTEKELLSQKNQCEKLSDDCDSRTREKQERSTMIEATRQEQMDRMKSIQHKQKQFKVMSDKRATIESEKDDLIDKTKFMKKDVDDLRKDCDECKNEIEGLSQQKNLLMKRASKGKKDSEKQQSLILITEGNQKNLERKLQAYRKEAENLRKEIYRLEKEREKYSIDAMDALQKYYQALEELKIKDLESQELQKKIQEGTERLKKQQSLYEEMLSERNIYSKDLIEAQKEISDMQKNFKMMHQQIESLKDENNQRQNKLLDERNETFRLKEEREKYERDLLKLQAKIKEQETINKQHDEEIYKLNQIIKEADAERNKQQKEYEAIVNDRDILGAQLIRRNDELAMLYEKIKIQQSSLNKGAVQYREKTEDIEILKQKISELKEKFYLLKLMAARMPGLKTEIHQLQRQLLEDKSKMKALSDELENPMNVHRWRTLEGTNPASYDMIVRIQTLQKNLIAKTEEVMEKDLLIQEKERLYLELKNILARQPGPEVEEQLGAYQETLKKKHSQMKSMTNELNLYIHKVKDQRNESESMAKELENIRQEYFAAMKQQRNQNASIAL